MLGKLILSVVVGVVVFLACILLGGLLTGLAVSFAVTIGNFLVRYAGVIGLLAALWYFFAGGSFSLSRK